MLILRLGSGLAVAADACDRCVPLSFEAASDDVRGNRIFTSFQACAEEMEQSRVYAGIHFPAAGREGLLMGRRIADRVWAFFD